MMKAHRAMYQYLAIFMLLSITVAHSQATLKLPKPKIRGQVMKALKNRISIKGFSSRELSDQVLSDMLWAAFGINDTRTGRRTAPSAFNVQEIDIYVIKADGTYLYNASEHGLSVINTKDIRGLVATQEYAKSSPVHLVYVADYDKAKTVYPDSFEKGMERWAMMHTGFIGQNVIIYCAANKLTAVVRSFGNRETLRKELHLGENQEIIITQAVGYPPK